MKAEVSSLITPYGGQLVNLLESSQKIEKLKVFGENLPSIQISERLACDLELLATGAFSPLEGFMGQADFQRVLDEMRLISGCIFPMPITLSVSPSPDIQLDKQIALRSLKNDLLAVLTIEEIYEWDVREFSEKVLLTQDFRHPMVSSIHRWGRVNISGNLQVIQLPHRSDFQDIRFSPAQTRQHLSQLGRSNVVAFQTRNPLHRVHEELTKRAIRKHDAALLLHPVVGMTKSGDVDHYTRVRTYKAMISNYYKNESVILALLPLAMRLAGPREALWHALIRRNYGANYLIVGRDHASPGTGSDGKPFYGSTDAQELVEQFSEELGVEMVPFNEMAYLPEQNCYEEVSNISSGERTVRISGTEIREKYLQRGKILPDWIVRPEVARILIEAYPPHHRQGVCIWFTGLSCSGKSTTAEILTGLLIQNGSQVTLLDGDIVRTHLSNDLGFSKKDRDTNILRIGYVASEIVRHGGTVICAAVSPYRATRNEVRSMVGHDRFVEVFVDTPLEVCEQRDNKGMYAKARKGEIEDFTGINDPYEFPDHSEIVLNTVINSGESNARLVVDYLKSHGLIREE